MASKGPRLESYEIYRDNGFLNFELVESHKYEYELIKSTRPLLGVFIYRIVFSSVNMPICFAPILRMEIKLMTNPYDRTTISGIFLLIHYIAIVSICIPSRDSEK